MNKRLLIAILTFAAISARAQQSPIPNAANDKTIQEDKQRQQAEDRFHNDWANLNKYREENSRLALIGPDERRVVFMGNSITEFWKYNDSLFFSGSFLDRGISGQTSPQMLVRFREDVINLKPSAVVILAGINDIAENSGPCRLEDVFGNIVSMTQLALAEHIKVVLSSVLPANRLPWRPTIVPTEKVVQLNLMIKDYAAKNNIVYLDYYSAMADAEKGLPLSLSADGVHPNLAGYKIMEQLAEKAIRDAFKPTK